MNKGKNLTIGDAMHIEMTIKRDPRIREYSMGRVSEMLYMMFFFLSVLNDNGYLNLEKIKEDRK